MAEPRSSTGKRTTLIVAVLGFLGMPIIGAAAVMGVFLLVLTGGGDAADPCVNEDGTNTSPSSGVSVDAAGATVAGYTNEQLENAAAIIDAGADLGISTHGQTIGVMTAIGESTLINIGYGDWETSGVRNPDGTPTCSLGLFQQQWCLGWGTRDEVLDPHTSATKFFNALLQVPGWQSLEPTISAHRTQNNRDPLHYARFWDDAVQIVDALTDGAASDLISGANAACADLTDYAGTTGLDGWVNPAVGRITSGFNPARLHPVLGTVQPHFGTDVAASCGTPVYAANAGTVIFAGLGPYQGRTGNQVVIDHGNGLLTRYGHLLTGTLLVDAGDTITAGQQIAQVGGNPDLDPVGAGNSTGCHLHFEVNDPEPVDAVPWMSEHDITLGAAAA